MVMPMKVSEIGQGIHLDLKRALPSEARGVRLSSAAGVVGEIRTLWAQSTAVAGKPTVQVQLTWIPDGMWGSQKLCEERPARPASQQGGESGGGTTGGRLRTEVTQEPTPRALGPGSHKSARWR